MAKLDDPSVPGRHPSAAVLLLVERPSHAVDFCHDGDGLAVALLAPCSGGGGDDPLVVKLPQADALVDSPEDPGPNSIGYRKSSQKNPSKSYNIKKDFFIVRIL